MRRLAGDADRQ